MRSCAIRQAHPCLRTPAGQAAPQHISRRCPPGCARASGLLLAPPRAMRCEPALCGSVIASSPPNRRCAHLLGTVAVAMVSSRHPSPRPQEFLARPALRAYSQGFRLSEVLCRCVAPVVVFPCSTLLPHACLPAALVQRRSCSRRFAALRTPPPGRPLYSDAAGRRSAGRFRQLRPEQSFFWLAFTCLSPSHTGHTHFSRGNGDPVARVL